MAGETPVRPLSRCTNAQRIPVDEMPFLWQSSRRSFTGMEFKTAWSMNIEGCRRDGCDRPLLRVAGILNRLSRN